MAVAGEKGADAADGSGTEERLTEDLLERLLVAATPEDYLESEGVGTRELVDYLRSFWPRMA